MINGYLKNDNSCNNCVNWNVIDGGCLIHNTLPGGCKDFRGWGQVTENTCESNERENRTKIIHIGSIRETICPNCLATIYTKQSEYPKYCNLCGCVVDWSE